MNLTGRWKEQYSKEDLAAETARLRAMHKHCDRCGHSWLDDGLNCGCLCAEVERLRDEIKYHEMNALIADRKIKDRDLEIDALKLERNHWASCAGYWKRKHR